MLGTCWDFLKLASSATASLWAFAENAARREMEATLGAAGRLVRAVFPIFWGAEAIGLD